MRVTLSILAVLAIVAAVSGQTTPDRRARFLKLRQRAQEGDANAQRILQASRRKRPVPGTKKINQEPAQAQAQAPVPSKPSFPRAQRVEEEVAPTSAPARTRFRRPQRVRQENAPAPVPATSTRSRSRTPLRTPSQRTRQRTVQRQRVVTPQAPVTFRPLTPFPNPTTQAPTTVQEIITEEPFIPTAIFTEAPVFETFAPTEAPITTQARFQPAPTQAPRFEAPIITQARFQPAPTQAPRFVVQEPVQEPVSRVRTNSRGEERVVVDFEPHQALQNGLEVDQRSEHFLGRQREGVTTEAPVYTDNRYSYFDEEGSYVFGYEASDGSFKEERRALNCIVYGKYGYVDPDGIRREFSYQSGNECDPNAVQDPNLVDAPAPVLNDQFNQQTSERQLSDAELQEVNFNRRRRPQQPRQPVQKASPRVRPVSTKPPTPQRPAHQRPAPRPPAPQPEVFEQQFKAQAPVTEDRFTTPSSLNPNHRFNQNVPADNFIENRKPKLIEPVAPRQQQVFKPLPVRPSPKPQFTQAPVQTFINQAPVQSRPTPKPTTFDFDREFENLFNHFGPVQGVTPRTAPRIPTPVQTTRVVQPQTFRPKPPTTRPPPPPTARPTTRAPPPPTTRQPPPPPQRSNPISPLTEGAHQLVFDPSTGGFKTVRTNVNVQAKPPVAPLHFQPVTSKPFVPITSAPAHHAFAPTHAPNHAAPTHAPRPASPPRTLAAVGVPLPATTRSFSPLPAVPTSGLIIHNQGSSVSTDEFDKFFSQFNLKF